MPPHFWFNILWLVYLHFTWFLNLYPVIFSLTPFGWFIFLWEYRFWFRPTSSGTQLWCKTRPLSNWKIRCLDTKPSLKNHGTLQPLKSDTHNGHCPSSCSCNRNWAFWSFLGFKNLTSYTRNLRAQKKRSAPSNGPSYADINCIHSINQTASVLLLSSRHQRWSATVQLAYQLTTGWTIQGLTPSRGNIFHTHPDQPWGPPRLLYYEYRVSSLGVKRPGCGTEHTPHLALRLKRDKAELQLYSPSGSSWPVLGKLYLSTFTLT
jgi:hypothetical protein